MCIVSIGVHCGNVGYSCPVKPEAKRGLADAPIASWLLAMLIGTVFLLPHLVRIAELGSFAAYTPFTAHSPSPMVWDETFLYGAEANYSLTRGGAPAYADTWEHRRDVYPYSILPMDIEALLANLPGGLKTAHLVISFLFPALTSLLLMWFFVRMGASRLLAGVLALALLVAAFSLRTVLMGDQAFLLHGHGARVFDSLQGARTPNPAMSFAQLLAAVLMLLEALRSKPGQNGWRGSAAAGVVGGLLFYSYV